MGRRKNEYVASILLGGTLLLAGLTGYGEEPEPLATHLPRQVWGPTSTITRPASTPGGLDYWVVYSKDSRLASLSVAGSACIEWFCVI